MSTPQRNLIIFYTGNGKGKTTASLGLACRALRDKMRLILVQFIKSESESGEVGLKKILPQLEIKCFGAGFVTNHRCHPRKSEELVSHQTAATQGLAFVQNLLKSKKYDVIILDEIFVALSLKLLKQTDIISLIKAFRLAAKPKVLVLTGRGCPKKLYKFADLITEMKEIKHPFQKGVTAIKGIDY